MTVKLTRGADYGARGMIRLAQDAPDRVMLVSEIATREGLPESYLAKIFQELARNGIVRSHRGAGGGFSLARPPADITLRQIVEAIEGPIALNTCLERGQTDACERMAVCPLYPVFRQAQEQLLTTLESTTLAQLAAEAT